MALGLSASDNLLANSRNWLKKNLFNTWYNIVLSIACLIGLVLGFIHVSRWAFTQAQWTVLSDNLRLFFVGRFPIESTWRIWAIVALLAVLSGLTWGRFQAMGRPWNRRALAAFAVIAVLVGLLPIDLGSRLLLGAQLLLVVLGYWIGRQITPRFDRWLFLGWLIALPVIFWLIHGGLGLQEVPPLNWSGLLLTLFASIISMVLSFPLGILLALGRRSTLPVVRWFSILYIEIFRGLPLIGVLFLALVMLPLVLPPEFSQIDLLTRAIAGLTLFAAAYLAEVVRGGLQAIPNGQIEAARALGLNPPLVIVFILLPQALRAVIPALVGELVGLFKDTSLLSVFGLIELLGMSAAVLANPQYIGRYAEVYVFVGVIYWLFCYAMSAASQQIETRLGVGER